MFTKPSILNTLVDPVTGRPVLELMDELSVALAHHHIPHLLLTLVYNGGVEWIATVPPERVPVLLSRLLASMLKDPPTGVELPPDDCRLVN